MQQLSNDGISFIKKSSTKLCHHIIEINRLISDRINNCKSLFPIWINWTYIKELFIMPNGLTEDGTKDATDIYYASLSYYPYQMYINWVPMDEGNVLYNDKKFEMCIRDRSKKRDNIRMQRNKLYAHNDEKRIVNSENLPNRYPISYPDVQEMIDFALDCTGLILGILTDVNHATQYSNIDDWEGTLMLARLGLKYQEYDFQQSEKAFEAEMQRQLGGNDNGELQ